MSQQFRGDVRVLRKKHIAETVRSVVNNKADVRDLETSLHSLYGRHEKHQAHERDVFQELIKSNVFMAEAVRQLQEGMIAQQNQILALQSEVSSLKRLLTGTEQSTL